MRILILYTGLVIFVACSSNEHPAIKTNEELILETDRLVMTLTEAQPVFRISDICLDEQENIYLVSGRQNLISKLNPEGDVLEYHSSPGRGPGDLARPVKVHCEGESVYVLEFDNPRIQEFDKGLNSTNIVSVAGQPMDFSIFEGQIYSSGVFVINNRFMILHKIGKEGMIEASAYEENEEYLIYSYSQNNFHGVISAYHQYDHHIHLFDDQLDLIQTIEIPSEIFTSIYSPGAYSGELNDSNITSALRVYAHSSIGFSSATRNYLLVHIRSINSPDDNDRVAIYLFDKNEWFVQDLDNKDQRFFQHQNNYLYSYGFDDDSEYGAFDIIKYQLNIGTE